MTKKQITTAMAGISNTTVSGSESTSAPPMRAPLIAPSSRAATSSPAARAVSTARPGIDRERDQISAISSGSQTT